MANSLDTNNNDDVLNDVKLYILPSGISLSRQKLFRKQAAKFGAEVHLKYSENTTHVVTDESLPSQTICKLLKWDLPPCNVKVVKSLWLSNCLKHKQQLDTKEYEMQFLNRRRKQMEGSEENEDEKSRIPSDAGVSGGASDSPQPSGSRHSFRAKKFKASQSKHMKNDSSSDASDEDSGVGSFASTPIQTPEKNKEIKIENFICSSPSSKQTLNHNRHITEKLEVLCEAYKNTKDQWRAFGYEKAIHTLKTHPKEVTSWEEARSLPGIGERLADKIWEIIQSGHLRKIDEVCSGENMAAISLFTKLWGAGPTTAETWVQQGYRTLDDLRTKAKLTKQQQIGLKHYDDLLERMPREEASEIANVVTEVALSINSELEIVCCGSYRRGKSDCGDVDVLISHRNGKSLIGLLPVLVSNLHKSGFLTDDLVSQEENASQKKYMGVCKLLRENRKHRRLDIIVVPYNEFACAQLYFTGSAHFNRSMRLLAKKMGMTLTEHSLNAGVIRNNQQVVINGGYPLPTPTEESVFQHLGLEYRSPEERDY